MQWGTTIKAVLGLFLSLQYLRKAMSDNGISAMPTHCTETGQTNPLPALLTDAQLITEYKQVMVLAAAFGLKHASWYSYDDSLFGYSSRSAVVSAIASFVTLLCGATISNVTMTIGDSGVPSVAATIAGTAYTF
jgi:hypothetical protein